MEQQEKLLLARIDDKLRETERTYDTSFLGFLTPGEQNYARRYLAGKIASWRFDGGYPDAERKCAVFLPEDVPAEELEETIRRIREARFRTRASRLGLTRLSFWKMLSSAVRIPTTLPLSE